MNLARCSSVVLLTAALISPAHLFAQATSSSAHELLRGTWVLDLSRSVFIEREAPKSQTMSFEPHEEGLQVTIIITNQNGIEDRISYIDQQNGEPAQLTGSRNFDMVVQENQGPYHATSIFTHAGMEVGRSQRTISLNGKEMMVEVERKGNLSSRAIFIKQG
jgi:hypothetical protein